MPDARSRSGSALHRGRCRCGHLRTHHMAVVAAGESANFRLDPVGPCELCGEGLCRRYSPTAG